MEPFNLLKFWRGVTGAATEFTSDTTSKTKTATRMSSCTEDEKLDDGAADEGPFFDLEFKAPVMNVVDIDECESEFSEEDDEADCESAGTDNDSEREYNFAGSNRFSSNLLFSPSDDNLFFKGQFLRVVTDNGDEAQSNKTIKRKSSMFKLGFKKSFKMSTEKVDQENSDGDSPSPKFKKQASTRKSFTRENSLRNHFSKQSQDDDAIASSEDQKFVVKGVVQKYMKMIKPLYVSVSKRYGEKSRFYNGSVTTSPLQRSSPKICRYEDTFESFSHSKSSSPKQGNLPSGLRVVCKHLGKSRSGSNFAAVSPVAKKQDDSMFQQEDGIQNAILHCKRSFNSPRGIDSSLLSRSTSDPTHEKSIGLFSEEMKFFHQNEAEDDEEYFDL